MRLPTFKRLALLSYTTFQKVYQFAQCSPTKDQRFDRATDPIDTAYYTKLKSFNSSIKWVIVLLKGLLLPGVKYPNIQNMLYIGVLLCMPWMHNNYIIYYIIINNKHASCDIVAISLTLISWDWYGSQFDKDHHHYLISIMHHHHHLSSSLIIIIIMHYF